MSTTLGWRDWANGLFTNSSVATEIDARRQSYRQRIKFMPVIQLVNE
jgi:hypothetical protein